MEQITFTTDKIAQSYFTVDANSPLWEALKGNAEAQNQLRDLIVEFISKYKEIK